MSKELTLQKLLRESRHVDGNKGMIGSSGKAVQCTGIVLAKLDGTAKGGVVVAIRQQVGLPVKYVGVGEKKEDLALFEPESFVEALFEDMRSEAG